MGPRLPHSDCGDPSPWWANSPGIAQQTHDREHGSQHPKGSLPRGLLPGHWVWLNPLNVGPGQGAVSLQQVDGARQTGSGQGRAGAGHLGASRTRTGFDPCGGQCSVAAGGRAKCMAVQVREGPEVDQEGFPRRHPGCGFGVGIC